MQKLKNISSVLKQTIIITIITLGLSEVTLRVYNKINPVFIFYENSYNRFRGKPFAPDYDFKLNSKGFKDIEHQQEKDKDTFRILGMGDSFAYGVVPYQYNYYTLLEQKLNQNSKKVEIINMGIPGTGPKDYLNLFVNEGLALKPDMLVLSFFVGNDFTDNQDQRPLYTYSYLATLVNYLIKIPTKYTGNVIIAHKKYDDNKPSFTEEAYLNIEYARTRIYRKESKRFNRYFTKVMSHILEIHEICKQKNIKLTIVIIPDEIQVNSSLRDKVIKTYNINTDNYDFAQPNKLLVEEFQKNNIDYIDLLNDFVTVGKKTNLYIPLDSHWNIAGNRLAAEIIDKDLSKKLGK